MAQVKQFKIQDEIYVRLIYFFTSCREIYYSLIVNNNAINDN